MKNNIECEELFLKIYNNPDLCDEIELFISNHSVEMNVCIRLCQKGKWSLFLNRKPFFKLCLVFACLADTKAKYNKKGIDDTVFFDTMSDIKIWIDDCRNRTGEYGLEELNWIMHHMSLNIFRLGRLQFQMTKFNCADSYSSNGISVHRGENILNLHIARGAKLDTEACRNSLITAQEFFTRFFPDYPVNIFMCHSWLLYSGNKNFMSEGSNILKFAEMFDIIDEQETPQQAYLWLFGVKTSSIKLIAHRKRFGTYGDTSMLSSDTKLLCDAKKYIDSGGAFGDAVGIITLQTR